MRILHVTHHFTPCKGGIETFVRDLCINLQENGIDTEVLCLDRCPNSKIILSGKDVFKDIKITRIHFIDFKYYKPAFFSLAFLKTFDVIHVHNIGFFSDWVLATKFFHKKPVIVSTHGGIWHTKKLLFLKKIYFNFFQVILLKMADKIIAVSHQDYNFFSKYFKNTILSENPVDSNAFLSIKKNFFNKNFIYFGRVAENKNILGLIKVFKKVIEQDNSVKLFIAGSVFDNSEFEKLKKDISGNENILFFENPNEAELHNLLKKSTFFVSASFFEGFGLSLLEAMAGGLIPIVNDISSFRNIVKESTSGFLTDFSDSNYSSDKILRILKLHGKKKYELSKNAQAFAKTFSWKKKIHKFISIYNRVLQSFS